MDHKRCRITIELSTEISTNLKIETYRETYRETYVETYKDDITHPKLLNYINLCIPDIIYDLKEKNRKTSNVTFQCDYISQNFANSYFDDNFTFEQCIRIEGNTKYLKFYYTINGFSQVSKQSADFAHNEVLKILESYDNNYKYIGIGGESLLYGICRGFKNITIYTNSIGVHNDNLLNCEKNYYHAYCNFVNYDIFKIINIDEPSICVLNVSRGGIRKFICTQLNKNLYIQTLITIHCSEESKNNDMQLLEKYYITSSIMQKNIIISVFTRIPMISLGNTCCIALQLQMNKLRYFSSPLDWIKYKSVKNSLIPMLMDEWKDFAIPISEKKPTGQFPIIEENFPSIENKEIQYSESIKMNKYNIMFPHDKLDETDMKKYQRRIERLKKCKKVIYILDCIISHEDSIKIYNLLPNAYKIIILSCDERDENYSNSEIYSNYRDIIKIINVSKYMGKIVHDINTWKKNYLNWKQLFIDINDL